MITIKRNYDEKDDDIDYVNDIGNGTDNLVSHLVLIGLEQDAHPVRVVVHGEVCEPGAGVRVDHDLVPADAVDHDALAGHRVLVVVLVVLVEDGRHLLPVLPDAQQRLLVVVGGDVEHEEVLAANRDGENAGVRVKTAAHVAVDAVEGQVLLTAAVVGLAPACLCSVLQFINSRFLAYT